MKSLNYVWNIDADPERKERIAMQIIGGESGSIRIT